MPLLFQKYLIRYGYLECEERSGETEAARGAAAVGRGRSGRTRRQINFGSLPAVSEGADPVTPAPPCAHTAEQVTRALRRYQAAYALPVTGTLDAATKAKMNLKRCGNADYTGTNSILGDRDHDDDADATERHHSAVRRSLRGNFPNAPKSKAEALIQERRQRRVFDALEADSDAQSNLSSSSLQHRLPSSSLLSRILLQRESRRAQPTQSQARRRQMLNEYEALFQAQNAHPKDGNARLGAFVSSKHRTPVITLPNHSDFNSNSDEDDDETGSDDSDAFWRRRRRHREKRSDSRFRFGRQRFNLNSVECIRWRLLREGYSQRLRVDRQRSILALAFRMWAEVTPLCFIEDNDSDISQIEIPVAFGKGQ